MWIGGGVIIGEFADYRNYCLHIILFKQRQGKRQIIVESVVKRYQHRLFRQITLAERIVNKFLRRDRTVTIFCKPV